MERTIYRRMETPSSRFHLRQLIGRELRNGEEFEKPFVKVCDKLALGKTKGRGLLSSHNNLTARGFLWILSTSFSVVLRSLMDIMGVISRHLCEGEGRLLGTTVTFVCKFWTVTVPSVGDSRIAYWDSQWGCGWRKKMLKREKRVTASGGEVGRTKCFWRQRGDTDVGEFIVPIPHVQAIFQMREEDLLSASDGIWDAINLLIWLPRSMMIQHALLLIIIPSDIPVLPPIPRKKHNMFQFAFWKQSDLSSGEQINQKAFCLFGVVEELLSKYFPANTNSGLCRCAVCQVDQTPGDSLSVNSCSFFSLDQSHGKAPSSAVTVRKKKDAMEGKRSSRPTVMT
ncbi:LOW QUALITY PROTEIN: hypothetical protein NC651_029623 [Populus alba x Populus x berolinensis]|nr:LOW QUALITY PROTEIN: hypothetical protein NC651_029623 [Populus alba x Populus x berolinensis]